MGVPVVSEVRIAAEPRTEFGKGGARRTRRAGKVPAVLYGHGSDVRHIALPARELMHAFKGDAGANVLLSLDLPDGRELALPRQVQRDPLRGDLTHIDLLLVRQGEKVAVDVPIVLVGEAPAAKAGGALDQQATFLHVEADATNIPTQIEVDISGLTEIGGHGILVKDLALPNGVTLLTDPEAIVVHVVGASPVEDEVADAAEAAAEAEEAAGEGAAETTAEGETPPASE
jgi:large subunit ribosomal protein L25